MSDLNQNNQDLLVAPSTCVYVNPVPVEEQPHKEPNPSSSSCDPARSKGITSPLQNGETNKKPSPQVKGQTPASQDVSYKRPPPPRPPSLGSGTGMGLLFSSPQASTSPESEQKEEGSEKEDRKATSPPPSRPPVPLLTRAAPPLPPAPVHRTSSSSSSRKGSVKERTGGDNGENLAKGKEKEGEKDTEKPGAGLQGEEVEQEASRRDEEDLKAVKEDTTKSQCPPPTKKPSRPVPPPRTKPAFTNPPASSSQGGGGSANQSTGMKAPPPPPPSPAPRPDVSLYSPQGGAALGADLDSCSTSSTEEEGETNQEQDTNHRCEAII